jgi:predicted dehydrogenase
MGSSVREVLCTTRHSGFGKYPVDDNADILLRFKNHAVCSIHMDYLQPTFRRSVELYGMKGTALWSTCDFFSPEADFIHLADETSKGWKKQKVESDVKAMYLTQMRHFMRCLEDREKPMVDHTEGADLMRVICGCVDSSRRGEWITIQ